MELDIENRRLQKLVGTLQGIVRSVDRFLQRKLGIGLPNEWLERAGLKEPSKKPLRGHRSVLRNGMMN